MTPIERLAVAAVVLAAGAVIGWMIRRRRHPSPSSGTAALGLPAGLVLITAPYCTRCASLRSRLTAAGSAFMALPTATLGPNGSMPPSCLER
jgi:ammonia channel protein AmtB